MKKLVCLLTVVLLVAALSTFAFAAEETTVTVDTVEATAGAEVKVYISLVNNPGIVLCEGTVSFDTTALELVSMEWVGMEDWSWSYKEMNLKTGYFLCFADAKAEDPEYKLNGDCALLCVTLKVKEDVLPGTYNVNVFVNDIGDDMNSYIAEETFTGAVVIACPGHVWDEGVVKTPATCKEEGVMLYTCTLCGETKEEAIPTTDHTWGEWEVTTPATCGAEGVETRTCSVCGETETRAIAMLEHDWVETERIEATGCTDGKVVYTCSICGETKEETLAASGEHTWAESDRVDATCCEDGKVVYTCSVCGETKEETIAATGEHALTYVDNADGLTHKIVCGNSNKELGNEDHTYGEFVEDTENPGWKYKVCDRCGYEHRESVPQFGDNSMIAVALATVSMMGIALVVSKKKEF